MAYSLRELVENVGKKADDLADATGCHRVTAYAWIAGRKRPRGHRLRTIASELGVSIDKVRAALDETERRVIAGKRP